jgi:hypothetical protein
MFNIIDSGVGRRASSFGGTILLSVILSYDLVLWEIFLAARMYVCITWLSRPKQSREFSECVSEALLFLNQLAILSGLVSPLEM